MAPDLFDRLRIEWNCRGGDCGQAAKSWAFSEAVAYFRIEICNYPHPELGSGDCVIVRLDILQ
jgi:hypothetical protein